MTYYRDHREHFLELHRQYQKKHKKKIARKRHVRYMMERSKQIAEIQERYANDEEFREAKKKYNRERMRRIRAAEKAKQNTNDT